MERISIHDPEPSRYGHIFRYRLASGFVSEGDVVLDAACGVGYGSELLQNAPKVTYWGVDRSLDHIEVESSKCLDVQSWNNVNRRQFVEADLSSFDPDFDYDVFVSFETVEHLADYSNLIEIGKRAKKWILFSAPVIPTKHMNEYHLHDFTSEQLVNLFQDDNWNLFQAVSQPMEFSEIYVFKRNNNG